MSHEWSDGGAEARRTRRRAATGAPAPAAARRGGDPGRRGRGRGGGGPRRGTGDGVRRTGRPASTRRGGAGSRPFDGRLLIADRGNNRLLLVDAAKHVVWRYPARGRPPPRGGFYFPDDAFFVAHGTAILSNRPGSIVEFTRAGHIVWRYRPVRGPGMLDQSQPRRTPAQRPHRRQRRLPPPRRPHRPGVEEDRLAVRPHRPEGLAHRTPQHPRRLRPARAEQLHPHPPPDRMTPPGHAGGSVPA